MSVFPTLSKEPNLTSFTEEKALNPVIRSNFENGYMLARSKYTAVPKKWAMQYNYITDEDRDILVEFEEEVCYGANIFEWTNPSNLRTYEVRFEQPLKYIGENTEGYWSVQINMVEARPNSEITS